MYSFSVTTAMHDFQDASESIIDIKYSYLMNKKWEIATIKAMIHLWLLLEFSSS